MGYTHTERNLYTHIVYRIAPHYCLCRCAIMCYYALREWLAGWYSYGYGYWKMAWSWVKSIDKRDNKHKILLMASISCRKRHMACPKKITQREREYGKSGFRCEQHATPIATWKWASWSHSLLPGIDARSTRRVFVVVDAVVGTQTIGIETRTQQCYAKRLPHFNEEHAPLNGIR